MPPETTYQANDVQLMARVVGGDRKAFEAIYDRYRAPAFSTAMRLTRQSAAAEEVTQEAFLELWRSAARYEPGRGGLKSWLMRIVHNRGIDALRRGARHRRNVPLEDDLAGSLPGAESTERTVMQRDASRRMRLLLAELPVKQQEIVELAYFRELTHDEMAKGLSLPIGTVKSRLRLAHTKLHHALASA